MQPLLDIVSRMLSPHAPELGPDRLKKCIPVQILPWCCDKRQCYWKLEKPLSKCKTQVPTSRLHISFLTVFSLLSVGNRNLSDILVFLIMLLKRMHSVGIGAYL